MRAWTKPNKCDNSGPNCVEIAHDEFGTRFIRNTTDPKTVVMLTAEEWSALEESIINGQRF